MKSVKVILSTFILLGSFIAGAQNYDQQVSTNTNNNDEEGEAQIAMDPNDNSRMVVGFMEFGTNSLNFKIHSSADAGDTWFPSSFDPASVITEDYPSYSPIGGGDIVFAYDVNGDLYCSWIYLLADLSMASPFDSCIWTSYWAKSTDNGMTFSLENNPDRFFARGKLNVNSIAIYDYEDGVADRQWMAVDHSGGPNHGNLYVGYINYPFIQQNTGLKLKIKSPTETAFGAENLVYSGNGQLTNLLVDENGVIHYTFADLMQNNILHASSSDGGVSFSNPHLISTAEVVFPQTSKINDRENAAPYLAIDGSNNLHIVWSDYPVSSTLPKSYYSSSTDNGLTWSTALDLENVFGGAVFMPTVCAYGDNVTISGNVLNNSKVSNYRIASSSDNGLNFNSAEQVTTGMIDFSSVGTTVFVGDYSSSIRTECDIFNVWTNCDANGCKQYISRYDGCLTIGLTELTPVNSTFYVEELYPNPVEYNLNINVNSSKDDKISVEIYDMKGKLMLSENREISKGKNAIQLSVNDLPKAVYQIKLTNEDNTFITRNLIKE